jgi:hypothetical protein
VTEFDEMRWLRPETHHDRQGQAEALNFVGALLAETVGPADALPVTPKLSPSPARSPGRSTRLPPASAFT